MNLKEQYRHLLEHSEFVADETQFDVVEKLENLCTQLATGKESLFFGWLKSKQRNAIKGIYLWGGVGRGKTCLMDLFYTCAPTKKKTRLHFYRFMQSVHGELKSIRNTRDPLVRIGRTFAKRCRLLCLDEFQVTDIGDAVILAKLLKTLLDERVVLVMTSNTRPKDLYKGGLQRDRFVPAIKLLESHTDVVEMADGIDYRLQSMSKRTFYFDVTDPETETLLNQEFLNLARNDEVTQAPLEVLGRDIVTRSHTNNLVWFDFRDICDGPRSKMDYIEIANCYRTVIISNVPQLNWELENQARRFIELVDEFYDRGVHLIISAARRAEDLYVGKRLVNEYQRTLSRLHEMQTERYLSRSHDSKQAMAATDTLASL